MRIRLRVASSGFCGTRLTPATAAAVIAPLLQRCRTRPDILLFHETEIDRVVFTERIALDMSIGMLSGSDEAPGLAWIDEIVADAAAPGTEGAVAARVAGGLTDLRLLFAPWRRLGDALRAPFAGQDTA